MTYVFYNPLADNHRGKENARRIELLLGEEEPEYLDITGQNPVEFLKTAGLEDRVVISGGDGTLHCFVNQCGGQAPEHPVWYFPCGSGNDFMEDIREREKSELVLLNPYIEHLPSVYVNGEKRWFINGIGYGIDGYCCEEGDRQREKSTKPINYTAIAIRGLLFRFKSRNATVTVDGVERNYDHVWLAPTMNGRFYGGGMMVAPKQNRMNDAKLVSTVIMHCPSKLKTLAVFPSIFKGEHVKHKEMVSVFSGSQITVSFEKPTALQVDGETIRNVTNYTVFSNSSGTANVRQPAQSYEKELVS